MEKEPALQWCFVEKLLDICMEHIDRIGEWDDMINMISDMMAEVSIEEDSTKIFTRVYQFVFRLRYRLSYYKEPKPFNIVLKTNRDGTEYYQISNYNWKMFNWCLDKRYIDDLTNDYFLVPINTLTDVEKHNFESKVSK